MDQIKKYLNRETVSYLVFGVLTTVVNYAVFHIMYTLVLGGENSLLANFIAWVAAVIFAYIVNKLFVFESKSWSPKVLAREIPAFIGARVASFAIEEAGLYVSEGLLHLNALTVLRLGSFSLDGVAASKIALSVIVVVLNYFFSKWFIFKKEKGAG